MTYYIFFLIPILVIGLIIPAYAEKGLNYDDIITATNPDGSQIHTWISAPERVLIDGEYVDFRFINGADFLSVETGHGSIVLNKSTCSFDFYQKGIIDGVPLFSDSIVAKMAVTGTENWNEITQINNAVCEASGNENELVAKKFVPNIGLMEYKYINTGSAWKTQLEATNLSVQIDKKFGFTQTINLNRDKIHYGGSEKNLDNYADNTFNRTWLENNQGKVINFLNNINFDFDLGFDNLKSIAVYDTGLNKSKLSFNYLYDAPVILPNETLIIDPTFTSSTPTSEGRIYSTNSIAATCPTTSNTGDASLIVDKANSGINSDCAVVYLNFDVSSITGTISSVTSGTITYDVTAETVPLNCDWKHLGFTGALNEATYDALSQDVGSVTDIVSNSATCQGVSDGNVDTFNSASYPLITSDVNTDNIVSVGIFYTDLTRDGSTHAMTLRSSDAILSFVYTTTQRPYAVTTLALQSGQAIGTSTANVVWTAPYAGGGGQTIIGYQINKTTPWTSNPLVFVNNTGTTTTYYNFTGLTFGTDYSFRVTAWTNVTGGHPLQNATGNVLNVTTSLNSINCCPPVLTAGSSSVTSINLAWTASTLDNLRGYKIERQTPTGAAWVTIIGNTSSTALTYPNIGLTSNILYNYHIYGLNGTGQSLVSNTKEMTTFHKPNAVTPLTATADSFSQILLAWTAPISYAPAIVDYHINYTTPYGNPTSIVIHSPNVTSPTYTVTGLVIGSPYSFRVSAVTIHGSNATGSIANATTSTVFDPSNLSNPDTTNIDDFQIFYTKTITNTTSILLDVTYPGSFTLTCNMLHKFSGDNNTYTGLTETATTNYGNDTGTVKSSFIFSGANTEVINVNCYNGTNPTGEHSAKYIITISQFELLNQIAHFRDGTYGTSGQFGGIDLITLIIVIIGMIGFNRVTPIAGVMFTIITVGVAAYFEIIEYYQIMFPALALIVLLAYTRTRQNDG